MAWEYSASPDANHVSGDADGSRAWDFVMYPRRLGSCLQLLERGRREGV